MAKLKQSRGQLTNRIKIISKKLLGYEITKTELRLLPYIQYIMVNEQELDPVKINPEEMKILRKWAEMGYITIHALMMRVSIKFWRIMNEIMYLAYVDIDR